MASRGPRDASRIHAPTLEACFPALGVPRRSLERDLVDFRRRVLPLLADPRAEELLDAATEQLTDVDEAVVIHADLGPAHILCIGTGINGVIDWSDVSVGDPATDLAWLLNGCRRRLRDPLIGRLDIGRSTVARADLLHQLGPWWEVVHGLDQALSAFIDSGLRGIRARLER